MSDISALGLWLEYYFLEHLVSERNLARNTRESYLVTFKLLVPFLCSKLKTPDDRLAVRDITSDLVLQFLNHLEEERGCSVQTRNQRLTAIRAFARYVGSRDPRFIGWSGQIRAIPSKKSTPQPIEWLTTAQMDAVLDVPDRKTARGCNEYALLLFLYNTGARVSEVTHLRVADLQVGRRDGGHPLATLHGKGGKIRQCPLWPETDRVLAKLVSGRSVNDPVFFSRYRKPYTRFGVYRLVERCAASVSTLEGRKITPHVLRHTTACTLLRSGVDINTIRAWLGHVSINTTNIYTEIDLDMKAKALALCDAVELKPDRPWKENKGLMAFLKSL